MRPTGYTVDKISAVVRLGSGWLAMADRTFAFGADDAFLVAWKSTDLVHWSRVAPAQGATCPATVYQVGQAALVGGRLVAIGNPWSLDPSCGETWIATVTP